MIRYVYPRLPGRRVTPFFRLGGNGLANSLFVFARALLLADRFGLELIDPPWLNIEKAPWLRGDKDKRLYAGLFRHIGVRGLGKLALFATGRQLSEDAFTSTDVPETILRVSRIKGVGFAPLVPHAARVRELLLAATRPAVLRPVNDFNFSNCVAVHVRRGDYAPDWRTPTDWYESLIRQIAQAFPDTRFLLFSDGTNEELAPLMALPNLQPVFFGNALADIWAISRCRALIGSMSTFSDWGAFLGQIPAILPKPPQFGRFLKDKTKELVLDHHNETIDRSTLFDLIR